ncbi:MAG TPA: ornithine cyclodeaminase family protein [Cytophagales bacterium]|nr:ornithine cyclodeaminase family protein [Cytophagales bacterium]HCR53570.1 ornithine cyclodeaminase family protein [Cytophagales bacterium]
MSSIISLEQIKKCISASSDASLIQIIEDGFVSYSKGDVIVPPVGHLAFTSPPGDLHIKYGYIKNDDFFVVKMASGFYDNPKIGLSSSNGLMLVFSQKTGVLLSVLLDEGYLTDIRTALAGAVVAKHLAPKKVSAIGIVGTGIQARLQLRFLKSVIDCRSVIVWGRSVEKMNDYKHDPMLSDFNITLTQNIEELTQACNFIVTTTPSNRALIHSNAIQPGTHITAVGADTPGKQELDADLFSRASIIVADSKSQCLDHGDLFHPVNKGIISAEQIIELGNWIGTSRRRSNNSDISIADLTGVAIQDIQIAKYVYQKTKG